MEMEYKNMYTKIIPYEIYILILLQSLCLYHSNALHLKEDAL